ncbi:MAG: hypothetical protein IT302_07785 [Dehalococcoidia bacterium]|nr:hypothetical protein [Dehalococcoidia bacterium]
MSASFGTFFTVRAGAYAAVAAAALLVACGGGDGDAPGAQAGSSPASDSAGSAGSGSSGGTTNVSTRGSSSGSGASSSSSGAIKACALVTKADAERALGEPVNAGEEHPGRNNTSECTYNSTGNYGANVVFVYAGKGPNERPAYDLAKRTLSRPEAISGIGDDAFAINLDAPVTQVHFVKGDSYVTVAITHLQLPQPERAQRARALAATVLANLR